MAAKTPPEPSSRFSHRFLSQEHDIVQEVAYLTGAAVTGFNFQKKGRAWLLVMKAVSAQRGGVVCFFAGDSPEDCLKTLAQVAATTQGVQWKPDKFSP